MCRSCLALWFGFMAYAFLFAGIGEYVLWAGISAYGLKKILKTMCRSCLDLWRVYGVCLSIYWYGEYVLCASVHTF